MAQLRELRHLCGHSQPDFGEMARKLFWASKGRDALKPNFNKWPEEPFLPSRNGSSGHLLKFGFKASRPLLAKWRKLRHLCPKNGQLEPCLSWWFCLLSGDNSDVFPGGFAFCLGITLIDVAYFGWVGWWMSGDMRELRHLCGHLQPDFGEWVGVAPSMQTHFIQYKFVQFHRIYKQKW